LEDYYKATKLGYSDYLHKNRLEELPERVFTAYAKHVEKCSRAVETRGSLLCEEATSLFRREKISYVLNTVQTIEEKYTFDQEWCTSVQVNAGGTERETIAREIVADYKFSQVGVESVATDMGIKLPWANLQNAIKGKLERSFTKSHGIQGSHQVQAESEVHLPHGLQDEEGSEIVSRSYLHAPAYRKVRCVILRMCTCCKSTVAITAMVFQPTGLICRKMVDVSVSNNCREINLEPIVR
jgi:hypothetical protein